MEGVAVVAFLLAGAGVFVFVGPGGGGGFAADAVFAGGGFAEGGGAFPLAVCLSVLPRRRSGAVAAPAAAAPFLFLFKKSKDKKGAEAFSSLEAGTALTGAASTMFGEERARDRARNAAAAEARCWCRGGRADDGALASSSETTGLDSAPPLELALHFFAQSNLHRV